MLVQQDPDPWLTVRDAASELRLSPRRIRRLSYTAPASSIQIRNGHLQLVRLNAIVFLYAELRIRSFDCGLQRKRYDLRRLPARPAQRPAVRRRLVREAVSLPARTPLTLERDLPVTSPSPNTDYP